MAGNENSGRRPSSELRGKGLLKCHELIAPSLAYCESVITGKVKRASKYRLQAAQDILNRAGVQAPKQIEAKVDIGWQEVIREALVEDDSNPDA